jgi:hypothetical protein
MGRGISITGFSWEWAHGLAGAITTAGAAIALSATVEEDITVESAAPPIVETRVEDKYPAVRKDPMPGLLLGLRILAADSQVQTITHPVASRMATDKTIAAVTIGN